MTDKRSEMKTSKQRLTLFFSLIFRQVEPKSCGIPDPYRARGRISARLARIGALTRP
jgi:hypothetical protein